MTALKICIALAIFCILAVIADDDHGTVAPNYDVQEFDDNVAKRPQFIMFYAPWCGHCKKLAPTWDKIAEQYAESETVNIAKVDCTVEKDLCTSQGVSGYPTLKFFNLKPTDAEKYKGGRDFDTLKAFIEKKIGGEATEAPASKDEKPKTETVTTESLITLSPENWDAAIKTESVFIKFYAPWCGHCKRLAPAWEELATHYKDDANLAIAKIDCTETVNKDICGKYEVRGYPTLLFFKNQQMVKKYQGARDMTELIKFSDKMRGSAAPAAAKEEAPKEAVVALTSDSFEKHTEKGAHLIKFYAPWCGHCKRLAPTWEDLATAYKGSKDISIAKVDCTDGDNKNLCSKYEVRGYPTLLFFKDGQMAEKYQQGRELGDLKKFISKKLGDSLKDDAKKVSEDGKIPTKSSEPTIENGVTVYNADNFAPGIAKGITFVKFYAPWCGHCKRLAPTWDDLAKAYGESGKVKIAKVDCTTDREVCTQYGVRGFPTLKLFKDGEIFHDYNGARDQKALEKFIESKTAAHDEL